MKRPNVRDIVILSMMILTFILVANVSLSSVGGMRINGGISNVQSDKDLTCYFTINANTDVNVTWYRNNALNLTSNVSCASGVECHTSIGSGTVPNSYTIRNDVWNCTISFNNGTGIENAETSVSITDAPPTQPRIFYINGSEIINATVFISEDSSLNLNVNSTDADNDAIAYTINDTAYCSINSGSGLLMCSPNSLSQTGSRTIRIGADTFYGATYQYLVFNVTPIPKFVPSLASRNLTTGQTFNYYITGEDDPMRYPLNVYIVNVTPYINLTLSTISNTAFMLMLNGNRTATYSETKDKNYTVTLRINDTDAVIGNVKNTTASFMIIGTSYNQKPNISYYIYNSSTITQGGSLLIYFNATDLDNNTLIFSTDNALYPVAFNSSTTFNTTVNDSSFAYGWINISSLSNDYVIYTNFTLYVFDGSEYTMQPISLSVINTNDAPIIHEISDSASNTLNNTNLSSLIAYTGVLFRFQVSATDVDDLTYDHSNTGIGVYNTNDSRFTIDSNSGLLSFIPNSSGNFSFMVTVTDFGGLNYSRNANLQVLVNSNPSFTVSHINILCYERDSTNWNNNCYYNISSNVTDSDPGDYISNFWTNSSIFAIGSANGLINFSATQAMVGNYTIQLNVTDTRGGVNSTIMNLIINNTNNPPHLNNPSMPLISNFIVGTPYQITYTASDLDLGLYNTYENLTFSYNITGPISNVSDVFQLYKQSETQAALMITPVNYSYEGNYSINVSVSDYYGNISSYSMHIFIYNSTQKPDIISIIPSGTPFNDTINNETWMNASDFPGMTTTINIFENRTYLFNQVSTADNNSYSNSLSYGWYYDGTLAATTSSYSKNLNFFSSGMHNLTFVATDRYESSNNFTWVINVTNVIRPPIYYNNSLENLTVPGSGFIPEYLTYSDGRARFYNPDDDPLNLGYNTDNTSTLLFSSTACAYANFSFEYNRLNVEAFDIGECLVIFTATNPLNSSLHVSSQMVSINITNISMSATMPIEVPISVASGGTSSSRPTPIPLPQEVQVPRPLQIVTPKLVTTYQNATIKVPVIINNTWNDTLIGITLEAATNAENVSLYIDRIYIPKLDKGESVETTLYVKNYKSEGHYEISIRANVTLPQYSDTATIYINSAEMNSEGEELQSRISFARDLLSSNPECQELTELLLQAKKELANNNYPGTAKIVDNVINGCKYLVNNAKKNVEKPSGQFIKTFEWNSAYNDYAIIGLFSVLFMISLYYILKREKPEDNI